ncbi:MAG TPA: biotin carboxylase N-terminal domain-containing protein [Steroidobacteraceae bacterium]|nr:biotin carboxylase N-terminal domain-containing protein [Steroidobacteraceae bacterium]
MLRRLLVANRGEIACRIFRTARRLGVGTVAVFSAADAGARHVRAADQAVAIGPPPARESYLDIERLLAAARATGADAIHPGYGFLAENAAFAQACLDAGFTFVGPPPAVIAAMGSKIDAKTRLAALGVPMLPGYAGPEQELPQLAAAARRVGLPLIVKPAAGGGGKGMQIVRAESELAAALAAARRLAASAFGDGALLLERYLAAPRHLEVQVFADTHGNCVHLGDRDCTLQRRHQKLIEEAPAPALPDELRERLRAAALTVARAIGYVSACTVEFLFDGREFFFLEMNTRLQVEHTVTEAVTGLDLVEWQLRVASGEPLPLAQHEIRFAGHAIEARVCAEDPPRDFLPSSGRLALLEWPELEAVRVDAGFAGGDTVPDCYDSLLGKVIAHGADREQAAGILAQALTRTRCAGVRTNERFLAQLLRAPRFLEVRHDIGLSDRELAAFAAIRPPGPEVLVLAALAIQLAPPQPAGRPAAGGPWAERDGFIPNLPARISYTLTSAGHTHAIEIACHQGRLAAAAVDAGPALTLEAASLAGPGTAGTGGPVTDAIAVCIDGRRRQARCFRDGARLSLWDEDGHYEFLIEDPRTREFTASAGGGSLTTPLPGVVVAVAVEVGQEVQAGDALMVIEAMKMEHTITAPWAGTVQMIHFAPGARVPEGSPLLELARAPLAAGLSPDRDS